MDEETALARALEQLDKAVAAVRLAVIDLDRADGVADAAGTLAHGVTDQTT